jgi:3'-phosphoadenosine 5'-phosphosulfate sulfotransferase (PAPS reductase)/FAD synthetase
MRTVASDLVNKIRGRRVVASISGGKDSAAMSLFLIELGIDHDRVFMDTGWEHPSTYEYIRGVLTNTIGPITEISGARDMVELVRHKGMFPGRLRRFCTQELKVLPIQRYLSSMDGEPINTVGIRAEESAARASMEEWEWSESFDCDVWRPIIRWAKEDVIDIHKRHALPPNPLYLKGASRVGCWPCIYARKNEIKLVADISPDRIDVIRQLEREIGDAMAARSGKRATWFAERVGASTIDEVVEWSRTGRGGRQLEMFDDERVEDGCVRWGLCDKEEK